MKVKKIIVALIALNFLVFIFSAYFIKPQKVHAAAPIFLRVVGGSVGERAVIGMMEKAGVKFATKSAKQKAVEKWNLELYKKIQEANKIGDELKAEELARIQNVLANYKKADVTPLPNKQGFGKVVMSSVLFLTGLDLVHEIAQEIKNAQANEEFMERMKEQERAIEEGETITNFNGFYLSMHDNDVHIYTPDGYGRKIFGFGSNVQLVGFRWEPLKIESGSGGATVITFNVWADRIYQGVIGQNKYTPYTHIAYLNEPSSVTGNTITSQVPKITEVPEIKPIGIPNNLPQEIPINIPETDDYPEIEEVPWNEPIGEPNTPPIESPIPDGNTNPIPDGNTDLNPNPDLNPLPEPLPEPLPGEPIPPDSEACKSPATDLLSFFKDSLIGNFACFNWTKLKMSGAFFTNKFPFSIPWDIGRALSATFGGLTPTDEIPSYQLKIFDWEQELTIPDYFAKWFKMIRVMLLVMFDIGLVWSVRKMLGGAS